MFEWSITTEVIRARHFTDRWGQDIYGRRDPPGLRRALGRWDHAVQRAEGVLSPREQLVTSGPLLRNRCPCSFAASPALCLHPLPGSPRPPSKLACTSQLHMGDVFSIPLPFVILLKKMSSFPQSWEACEFMSKMLWSSDSAGKILRVGDCCSAWRLLGMGGCQAQGGCPLPGPGTQPTQAVESALASGLVGMLRKFQYKILAAVFWGPLQRSSHLRSPTQGSVEAISAQLDQDCRASLLTGGQPVY